MLGANGFLQHRKVIQVVHQAFGYLQSDIIVHYFQLFLLGMAQYGFYFVEGGRIMGFNRPVGETSYQGFHQQEGIGLFVAEGYRRQEITLNNEIAFVLLEAYWYPLLTKRLDIAIYGPYTDPEFLCYFFGTSHISWTAER